MSLVRRDKGGGSSDESKLNRRSLGDLVSVKPMSVLMSVPMSAPIEVSRPNNHVDGILSWKEAQSPVAAHSPQALVPAACFPPRHPESYGSKSEAAQPGVEYFEESSSGEEITVLTNSLESMKIPFQKEPRTSRSMYAAIPRAMSVSHDQLETVGVPWPPEQPRTSTQDSRHNHLNRRASFCGSSSTGKEWASRLEKRSVVVWSGILPPRCMDPSEGFSAKVFFGGLPWDITEQMLLHTLQEFNPLRVEWPVRDSSGAGGAPPSGPRGYAYVTFENERRVRSLLEASRCDGRDWYYHISSRKMRNKEVQVIPWAMSDSSWMNVSAVRLSSNRTVFVGALHGMISAYGLATIMDELFSGVIYAGIDMDKQQYPIGSGRVTFNNLHSYICAISTAFVEIHTPKFTKKIQIDPYLEDSLCSMCGLRQGPYFCREPICFGYYCRSCWVYIHGDKQHKPLMRCSKNALVRSVSFSVHNGVRSRGQAALPPPKPRHQPLAIAPYAHNVDKVWFNGAYSRPSDGTPSPDSGVIGFSANCSNIRNCNASSPSASSSTSSGFSLASVQEPRLALEAGPSEQAGPSGPAWPRSRST